MQDAAPIINVLKNPGFETGDFDGWTVGGKHGGVGVATDGTALPVTSAVPEVPDLFFASWQNVRSGQFAAYAITAGDGQEPFREYASFSQTRLLPAGTYQFGFCVGTDNERNLFGISSALDSHRLGVFVDGTYVPFLSVPLNVHGGSGPNNFYQFVSQATLPGGEHEIQFRISGSGTARVGFSFDDAFVVAVPEPACIALAILGSLIVVVARLTHRAS